MGTSTITITDRGTINVTGITSIIASSCSEIILMTDAGVLKINGSRLTISDLNLAGGAITITGVFWGANYTSN